MGRTEPAKHVDHILPKAWGGDDNIDNLQPLCVACHDRKTGSEVTRGRFRRVVTPTVLIVGPPGAGKTTLVRKEMQAGDLIVDVDALFQALSGLELYDGRRSVLLPFVLDAREAVLRRLSSASGVRVAWVLTTEGDARKIRRLRDELQAQCWVLPVPAEECLARIQRDDGRQRRTMPWDDLVHRWWSDWRKTDGVKLLSERGGGVRSLGGR